MRLNNSASTSAMIMSVETVEQRIARRFAVYPRTEHHEQGDHHVFNVARVAHQREGRSMIGQRRGGGFQTFGSREPEPRGGFV